MDITRLLSDYHIPFQTEGHKHCRPGWVNMECPFCHGNAGLHLGYDMEGNYFCCWRCGGKRTIETLAKLTHLSENEVRDILPQYGGTRFHRKAPEAKVHLSPFKYPSGTGPMLARHNQYLIKRGFDPEETTKLWHLQGTGPIATLSTKQGKINYAHRIVIPIQWENDIVSFQARDITGKHELRYIACPEEREKIKHKHILYGTPERLARDEAIIVEGVTDAWRFRGKAVATFGIKYTTTQLRLIAKLFKRVVVIFDCDPQAIAQAEKLVHELRFRGTQAESIRVPDDPGSMSYAEATQMVEQLGIK